MHICPDCKGPLKYNNICLTSCPPQYQHKCMVCNRLVNITPEEPLLPRFIAALETYVDALKRGDFETAAKSKDLMLAFRTRMWSSDLERADAMVKACGEGFTHMYPTITFWD